MQNTRTSTLLFLAIFSLSVSPLSLEGAGPIAHAAEGKGTVIVEQKDTEYLGKWGLATPVGVIEGESKLFRSERKAGNYALTVSPPAGATSIIEVYEDDELIETFDSRTANGFMGSGGTLKFTVIYDFVLLGSVSVTSKPSGIRFELKGPRGVERGSTPESYKDVPEGNYIVYFKPPKPCVFPRPIARNLKPNGRVAFELSPACLAEEGAREEGKRSSDRRDPRDATLKEKEEEKEEERPQRRERTASQNPLRVSLSAASAEVAAGGSTRFSATVLNRTDAVIENLTVEFRFDGSRLEIAGARNGNVSENTVTWAVASLPAKGKWDQSFTAKVKESTANGAMISSTLTVSGEALESVRVSNRSASVQIGIIKILPQTGVPLDLVMMLFYFAATFLLVGFAGVKEIARR